MKGLLTFFFLLPSLVFAQTFTDSTRYAIPANGDTLDVPVNVSGLVNVTSSSFGLLTLCLDIRHQHIADLRIGLRAPNDSIIILADQKGGSDTAYANTCFQENAANG